MEKRKKVYTTEIVVEEQEFVESKSNSEKDREKNDRYSGTNSTNGAGFLNIPEGIDEKLPFN